MQVAICFFAQVASFQLQNMYQLLIFLFIYYNSGSKISLVRIEVISSDLRNLSIYIILANVILLLYPKKCDILIRRIYAHIDRKKKLEISIQKKHERYD